MKKKSIQIYVLIVALTAFGLALSNNVLSNYFKDVYQVTAEQRGFIEFPREVPGLVSILVIGALSFMSDIKISILAQALSIIGIMVLGLTTPEYNVMLVFIFINSMGMHLFMPMRESIGMSLVGNENVGKRMGQFKGVDTAFRMIGALLVFLGFRYGFFTFNADVKWVFIIAAFALLVVFFLLIYLNKLVHGGQKHSKRPKLIVKKRYKFYYILVVLFGVQKQIMMVYAPWVLIDLLNKPVEVIAILSIVASFVGIFFIPAVGRWLDRFGYKKLLYVDALSFIGVYLLFGVLCASYVNGSLPKVGWPVYIAYVLFIIDRMSTQLGLVRTVYLKKIAERSEDITPTLSLGMTLDHFVSIIAAALGGLAWGRFGPQYIFFGVALLSFINLFVAIRVREI